MDATARVGGSVTSRIHFDAHDNLHAVLHGRKVFHLYPPDSSRVRPAPRIEGSLNNTATTATILPGHDDDAREALFSAATDESDRDGDGGGSGDDRRRRRRAAVHRADVRAGHALFIPAGWWHEVFPMGGLGIAANAWWRPLAPDAALRPTLIRARSRAFADFAAAERRRRRRWDDDGDEHDVDGGGGKERGGIGGERSGDKRRLSVGSFVRD